MRLVDYFIDVIVLARTVVEKLPSSDVEFTSVKEALSDKLFESIRLAEKAGFSEALVNAGLFPVVAYIDELILCSEWPHKAQWQRESLQRKYFSTTNIGSEFYTQLNNLSKHGPDKSVREVYVLCLGLGFKGKYFSNDDRRALEEVKSFNLELLMPEEAQRSIDTATLFPTAYSGHNRDGANQFKARLNVIPYVIAFPVLVSLGLVLYYHFNLVALLDQITKSVQ